MFCSWEEEVAMNQISKFIEKIEKFVSIILIAALTFILFLAVIYRYFLNSPLFWANEISIFIMAWLTFLGGSLSFKYKSQASITFLSNSLSTKNKRILNIITHIIMLVFLAILIYVSYYWIFNFSHSKSSALRIPMWIPYLSVPVGLSFMFIHLFTYFIQYIRGKEIEENTI